MKPWANEVCSSQPEELQIIGPETYIQRRNITAVEHPEQDGTPAYTCLLYTSPSPRDCS